MIEFLYSAERLIAFQMRRQCYYRCRCFLRENLFLPQLKRHVSADLLDDKVALDQLSKETKIEAEEIRQQIQNEIANRLDFINSFSRFKQQIRSGYKPLHPHIYQLSDEFLHPSLIGSRGNVDGFLQQHLINAQLQIYKFPVFNDHFIQLLTEELAHFDNSANLPRPRPNTMNNSGVLMDLIGFEPFMTDLRLKYLSPLGKSAFPEWFGDGLDTHKSFTIAYGEAKDSDLAWHYDNAEITLNICLAKTDDLEDLYFGGMYDQQLSRMECQTVCHTVGWGLFHRGRQFHGALRIQSGSERQNLVVWLRSSSVRNSLCPMCLCPPDLFMPSESDFGDGFTRPVVNVCNVA